MGEQIARFADRDQTRRWYVAATQPHKESVAAQNLVNQGFEVFLPKCAAVTKQRSIGQKRILRSLFPGYVFVKFQVNVDRWQAIRSTRGVRMLIATQSGAPIPVPLAVMADLLECCVTGEWSRPGEKYLKGQVVHVVGGAFAGLLAEFDQMMPNERVRVLLQILGGQIRVDMPTDQVA